MIHHYLFIYGGKVLQRNIPDIIEGDAVGSVMLSIKFRILQDVF